MSGRKPIALREKSPLLLDAECRIHKKKTWFDRLPLEQQSMLIEARNAIEGGESTATMASLYAAAKDSLGLACSVESFRKWFKRETA